MIRWVLRLFTVFSLLAIAVSIHVSPEKYVPHAVILLILYKLIDLACERIAPK